MLDGLHNINVKDVIRDLDRKINHLQQTYSEDITNANNNILNINNDISNLDNNMSSLLYILAGLENSHVQEELSDLDFK
jgi:hypothetical protein